MRVNICLKDEVSKVGDAYVEPSYTMLYTDMMVVKAEEGVYLVTGYYDNGEFIPTDLEEPAYFIPNAIEMSIEDIKNLIFNDIELPSGIVTCAFTVE